MRKSVMLWAGVCAGAMLLPAAEARAQWPQPLGGRVTVGINGGGQTGSTDVFRQTTFPLYEDQALFESGQRVSTGAVFDIGATVRVGRNWGVGVAYNASGNTADAAVSGSLPHPVFFGQDRLFTITATGFETSEKAVHVQAVLFVPFIEKMDFVLAAGPSFFSMKQDFINEIGFSEVPPAFATVNIDGISRVALDESAAGFNISGEAIYRVTDAIGAGLLLRYTRGTVEFDLGQSGSVDVQAGGFQALAGVRLKF